MSFFSSIGKIFRKVARVAAPVIGAAFGPIGAVLGGAVGSALAPSRPAALSFGGPPPSAFPRPPPLRIPARSLPIPRAGIPVRTIPERLGDMFLDGPRITSTGRMTGIVAGGKFFNNRRVAQFARQLGFERAADCFGVSDSDICTAILNVPKRRARGISGRDISRCVSTAKKMSRFQKSMRAAVGSTTRARRS